MRKIAIVIALALLLALAVAAPALAAAPRDWQAHKAPSPEEAYVFPMSGTDYWWEVTADGGWIENFGVPIPSSYPIFICFGWGSPIRGTVVNIPYVDRYAFRLTNAAGEKVWGLSTADAMDYWSVLYSEGTMPAFNKPEAKAYYRDWYVPVDLPAGSYTGTTTETVRRMITDSSLDLSLLPPDADWAKHVQQRPLKMKPTPPDKPNVYTFAFTIAP